MPDKYDDSPPLLEAARQRDERAARLLVGRPKKGALECMAPVSQRNLLNLYIPRRLATLVLPDAPE